jgi:hypothetical protein
VYNAESCVCSTLFLAELISNQTNSAMQGLPLDGCSDSEGKEIHSIYRNQNFIAMFTLAVRH